jgi:hypothetical protein
MASLPKFRTLEQAFIYCRDMDASLSERLEAFSKATRYLIPDTRKPWTEWYGG